MTPEVKLSFARNNLKTSESLTLDLFKYDIAVFLWESLQYLEVRNHLIKVPLEQYLKHRTNISICT